MAAAPTMARATSHAAVAATIGRLAMDVCLFMSQNFGFVSLPDELQKQISLKLPLDLLARIDTAARELNLSRASFIKMQMTRAIAKD